MTLSPPTVSADGFQHYVNQGGMELVTFNVSGSWNEAGVRVGKYTFRVVADAGEQQSKPAVLDVRVSVGCRTAT